MGNVTAKTSGDIASFMTPAETNIKSLKVHFSPKQLGEGDPSPENVREIVGWDGVEVNQYNPDFEIIPEVGTTTNLGVTWTVNDDGIVTANGAPTSWSTCSVGYISVNGNETIKGFIYGSLNNITFNAPTLYNSKNETITWERNDNALHSGLDLSKYPDVKKVRIVLKRTTNNIFMSGSCYIVIKKQENINKPFKTDFSFNWTSNIGTIYGGYVDLISGELVQEYGRKVFIGNEDENFSYYKTGDLRGIERHTFHTTSLDRIIKKSTTLSSFVNNSFPINNATSANDLIYYVGTPTKEVTFYINSSLCEPTVESFSNWLSENPIDFVYQLATPITHQLTPTQLSSFIGQNNFWSNADYIEVEYELKETEDIQKVRKKIILNQPHIESVKDNLVNFTTNMKAPLKECKVYFEPVQEGEGDPSPENVREIKGWDGVNVYQSRKNLCDNSKIKKGYFVSAIDRDTTYVMGHEISYNSSVSVSDYIKVEENSQYTCSFQYMPYSAMGFIFFSEKNEESAISSLVFETDIRRSPYTFIVPSNCKYIRINTINLKDEPQILLELGNTATLYEPYQGTTIPINWSDEIGTVYGGYVDLVKGELVATHVIFEKKWSEYPNNHAMADVNRRSILFPYERRKIGATRALCNIAPPAHDLQNKIHFYIAPENNYIYMFLPKDLDEETLIQVASKIEEPIHYQLTPQQLLTLKGTNNIWSNSNGQTEVKFWTH